MVRGKLQVRLDFLWILVVYDLIVQEYMSVFVLTYESEAMVRREKDRARVRVYRLADLGHKKKRKNANCKR